MLGTLDTCQIVVVDETTKLPTNDSCWRFSCRHQLQVAKQTNGFMLQIVELDNKAVEDGRGGTHKLGNGQEIEVEMAQEVGTKIFRVYEPFLRVGEHVRWKRPFLPNDVDALVTKVKEWYDGDDRLDEMSMVEVHYSRISRKL